MTRAVLDTNVVVSAHIQPAGVPARILLLALAKEFELYVSSDIVDEYQEVLRRPKFNIDADLVDQFLKAIARTAVAVRPHAKIRAASDPDDDKFLECAFVADADYLVTGNLKDYPSESALPESRTRIVSPREFLNIIERQ